MKELRDFRCKGVGRKEKPCNQLLFKYSIEEDEMIVSIKCPSCNTFSILHLPFNNKSKNHESTEK
jgi:hypothetical protein